MKVGDRVVCVDNIGAPELALGGEYTIASFEITRTGHRGIRLREVTMIQTPPEGHVYGGFKLHRFRAAPVVADEVYRRLLRFRAEASLESKAVRKKSARLLRRAA